MKLISETYSSLLRGVREGGFTAKQRWAMIAGTMLLAFVLAYFDYRDPSLRLVALAILFVIAIAGVGGLRAGIAGALTIAILFSLAESPRGFPGNIFTVTIFLRITSYLIAVGLVQLIRRQAAVLGYNKTQISALELAKTKGQLVAADARYRAVGESLPFGVWHCNADGQVVYMSDSFLELVGMTLEETRAGGWLSRVLPEDGERLRRAWGNRDQWGDVWEDEYRLIGADGNTYTLLCRGRPVRDEHGRTVGWTGINLDITQRSKDRSRLEFLAEAGRTLNLSLDPLRTIERIANLTVPRLADWCAVDLVQEDGELRSIAVQHGDASKTALARELRSYPPDTDDTRGARAVVRTGTSQLYPDISDDLLRQVALDEKHLQLLRQVGFSSAMIVPLKARDRVLGAMTFVQAESGRRYTEEDVAFAEMLAARAALAYDNARTYAREHRVADTLQRASLPTSLPQLPGIRLRAAYVPGASESEIGGDWYDAFALPDGTLAISIGDVAGKGLRAAVAMSAARQAMRAAAFEDSSPREVMRRVNLLMTHEPTGMITAVFGVLNPVTLGFRFATAGHPPPLHATPDGKVEKLVAGGLPLGLFSDHEYVEGTATLEPGSLLAFYTDGLIEFDRKVVEGEAIVANAVAAEAQSQTPDPATGILRRVVFGAPADDIALLTVSVSSEPLDRVELTVDATPSSARVLRQTLRRLAMGLGLGESETTSLLVASGEAISNVIEHAYGSNEGSLELRAFKSDGELLVEVKDQGHWREPVDVGKGRGMTMMRAFMDAVDVRSTDEGTTVLLRKSLSEHDHDRSGKLSAPRV